MKISALPRVCCSALLLLVCTVRAAADPLAELAPLFSSKDVNLEKLAAGQVLTTRGPAMSSARGLAVESCYVVRSPLGKTAEAIRQYDPTRDGDPKVFLHGGISSHATPADFRALAAAPASGAVKTLSAETQKLGSGATELQLARADVAAFSSAPALSNAAGGLPGSVAGFWSQVLAERAQTFAAGGLARLPAYETGKEPVRVAEEAARLLKDAPKVSGHFSALIKATPLSGGKGSLTPTGYWELFDIEGRAVMGLGAHYSMAAGAGLQAVDVSYYASGGYDVLLTFYQMWPVVISGQDSTLIWRTDLISAPSLAGLHGVERMGSSTAMMRETQKAVSRFLKSIH